MAAVVKEPPKPKPTSAVPRPLLDQAMYIDPVPTSDINDFEKFREGFDVGSKTSEISDLPTGNAELTTIHADLVPDRVPYADFWLK